MALDTDYSYGGDAEYPEVTRAEPIDCKSVAVIGPRLFATWLDAIAIVHDEAPFRFDEEGIHASVVNHDKTVQVETTLFREACWEYQHHAPDAEERAVAVGRLQDTTAIADPQAEERIRLTVDEIGQPLRVRAGPVDRTVATFDEVATPAPTEIGDVFTYRAAVERSSLAWAVRKAATPFKAESGGILAFSDVSHPYEFRVNESGDLHIVAESDIDDVDAPVPTEDVIEAPDGPLGCRYDVEYVRSVVRAIPDGATVALQFGPQAPLRIRWVLREEIDGVEREVAEATYVIAPRVGGGT
jgi:hypothetical protein